MLKRTRRGELGLALVVLMCSTVAATPLPSPDPSADGSQEAPIESALPSPSPEATTAVPPGSRHADPALESQLPTPLGGISLTVESQAGTDLSTTGTAFEEFLEGLGRDVEDFSLASAYSRGGDVRAQVGAWRVAGAESALLLPGYTAAIEASSAVPLTVEQVTLGERTVTQIGAPGELAQGPLYVYVLDDTLLFVQTPDPALAEEAISKLP